MKARVEDDGGRGVVARFVARFGDDEALRVGWPRFGRWRTKDRRRGDEVAMLRKKYIPRVCLSRYTSVFYKKYVGCYGCARSANFVYYFKSIYSCLPLHPRYSVLAYSPSMKFTILSRNHERGSILGVVYIFKQKQIFSSCPLALGRINHTFSMHTSIATHACMSFNESQKTWSKVSGLKRSFRCEKIG